MRKTVSAGFATFVLVALPLLMWGVVTRLYDQHPSAPSLTTYSHPIQTDKHNELYYTRLLAKRLKWVANVKTPAGTYCDLVSPTMAVEVEWSNKPYEALGQSLHYANQLDKQPAIVFLLAEDRPNQSFALSRVGFADAELGVAIWWYDTTTDTLTKGF